VTSSATVRAKSATVFPVSKANTVRVNHDSACAWMGDTGDRMTLRRVPHGWNSGVDLLRTPSYSRTTAMTKDRFAANPFPDSHISEPERQQLGDLVNGYVTEYFQKYEGFVVVDKHQVDSG
jgi:hypothetical protein